MSGAKMEEGHVKASNSTEKFSPKNWKTCSKKTLQKMCPQERSRYLAYEGPSKDAIKGIEASKRRISEMQRSHVRITESLSKVESVEKYRHDQLIGQLKAAEARSRVRLLRLKSQRSRANEVNHLIACQPSAIKAVRLQTLLPPIRSKITVRDLLGKDERIRVESLLEDEGNLQVGRILT